MFLALNGPKVFSKAANDRKSANALGSDTNETPFSDVENGSAVVFRERGSVNAFGTKSGNKASIFLTAFLKAGLFMAQSGE